MQITTWNVNGFRSILKKGFRDWLLDELPDVLCMQETRVRPSQVKDQVMTLDGYQIYWCPAERPGYSGVACLSKIEPLDSGTGLGIDRFDREGRLVWLRFPEFTLYNVYFPSGQRGKERVDFKLEFYESLLRKIIADHAEGDPVIIAGDFNTAHKESDLRYPARNQRTSGFLPEERAWVSRYLESGLVDIFRTLYPEERQYTWWTYRNAARERDIGWRLDYFLVSEGLVPRIHTVTTHSDVFGSDHCPVSIRIDQSF